MVFDSIHNVHWSIDFREAVVSKLSCALNIHDFY